MADGVGSCGVLLLLVVRPLLGVDVVRKSCSKRKIRLLTSSNFYVVVAAGLQKLRIVVRGNVMKTMTND